MMNFRITIFCLVLGSATEALAYWQNLWVYDRRWTRAVTLVIVYGLLFSWLSISLVNYSAAWRFAAGAVAGVVYETLNITIFRLFTFPNQRMLFLRGPLAIALGAGVCWGLLPLVAPLFR